MPAIGSPLILRTEGKRFPLGRTAGVRDRQLGWGWRRIQIADTTKKAVRSR